MRAGKKGGGWTGFRTVFCTDFRIVLQFRVHKPQLIRALKNAAAAAAAAAATARSLCLIGDRVLQIAATLWDLHEFGSSSIYSRSLHRLYIFICMDIVAVFDFCSRVLR